MGLGETSQPGIERLFGSCKYGMGKLRTQRGEGLTEPQGMAKLKGEAGRGQRGAQETDGRMA